MASRERRQPSENSIRPGSSAGHPHIRGIVAAIPRIRGWGRAVRHDTVKIPSSSESQLEVTPMPENRWSSRERDRRTNPIPYRGVVASRGSHNGTFVLGGVLLALLLVRFIFGP